MTIFFNSFFYFSEKTSLDISCESSAWQMIHMKCQDLFSLNFKKKILGCRLLQILLGILRINMCAKGKLKSACTSVQSDQSLCCPYEESLYSWVAKRHPVKILIRLHKCTVWSESLLGAYVWRYVFWPCGLTLALLNKLRCHIHF